MSLGCGDYRALILPRATLARGVLEVPWASLKWGRVLDDTSSAEVTGGAGCCDALLDTLGAIRFGTWSHTLAIVRVGDGRVWSGPVVNIRDTAEGGLVIGARDLSAWLDHRLVHDDHFHTGEDPAAVYQSVWDDAMAPDPIEDYTLDVTPTALTIDREVLSDSHALAGDTLRDLSTVLDWTVIDRVHFVAGQELVTPALGPLIDEHFTTPPDVEIDGTAQANSWTVTGSGGGAEGDAVVGTASTTPGPEGLLESVASEPDVLDFGEADDSAQSRLDRSTTPPVYVREGVLGADAPVSIAALVPGARVRIALDGRCLPVRQLQRLVSVDVQVTKVQGGVSEQVTIALEPPGTLAA